jgi:transcriptional regulator with XRE-family HTH domain
MSPPVELGSDLRNLIRRFRRDPDRWGTKRGLSQAQAAAKIGISQVWWRQIENGYTPSASATTLADMCFMLGIETALIRALGYVDVAEAMDAIVMARHSALVEHARPRDPEAHIMATPGLDDEEIDVLIQTLRVMRRTEPLGPDVWHRRKAQPSPLQAGDGKGKDGSD